MTDRNLENDYGRDFSVRVPTVRDRPKLKDRPLALALFQ